MTETLKGKRIALAEARELDLLAGMLEREGASVVRCPLIAIKDVADAGPVEAWIARVISRARGDVIFYTGEGVRRLAGFAERAGHRDAFIAALTPMRKIARGPKPVKALRELGLSPDLTPAIPTTEGLVTLLESEDLRGRSVGLQIYGQEPNAQLIDFLRRKGADVDIVAPYIYASAAEEAQVLGLIDEMAAGRVDAIAFTSSPQIRRLEEAADKAGRASALKAAFAKTRIAAIGPVVAQELGLRGLHAEAMPENSFTMKPLVRAISRMFAN